MKRIATGLAGVLAALAATAATARGEYIVNVSQVGADVVATGSGTLNLAALTIQAPPGTPVNVLAGGFALLQVGSTPFDFEEGAISGPTQFGTGFNDLPSTSQSGDFTGIAGELAEIEVPTNYVSGNPLSGSATWAISTFSSLGLAPGIYTWTWGSGDTADSFVLDIGAPTTVPEPASLTLLIPCALGLAGYRLRRRAAE